MDQDPGVGVQANRSSANQEEKNVTGLNRNRKVNGKHLTHDFHAGFAFDSFGFLKFQSRCLDFLNANQKHGFKEFPVISIPWILKLSLLKFSII
jgi:hypothetical protein